MWKRLKRNCWQIGWMNTAPAEHTAGENNGVRVSQGGDEPADG